MDSDGGIRGPERGVYMEDIERLRDMIASSERIAFLGGAGLSTESGIPDFRSEDGIFAAIREFGYPPETLLSHSFFLRHTNVFYQYYKKYLLYPGAKPNRAHDALARMERDGKLTAVITQNIDGLHQRAGSKNVFELHGSVYRNHCMKCGKAYSVDAILAAEGVPHCDCGGIIKPDVVLYEEGLDDAVVRGAITHIVRADMLIIGGTSLLVYPAAGLADYYTGDRLAVINLSETHQDVRAALTIRQKIGEALSLAYPDTAV